jgi:uncharacterized protein YdaU (DUF1376 family)
VPDFPYLPLKVADFEADTSHLSDAELGRYVRLLFKMWTTPGCRVPNDDKWLARHLRRTPEETREQIRPIIAEFCRCTGNWILQKRLRAERDYIERKRNRGSVAAKARWDKEKAACDLPTTQYNHLGSDSRKSLNGRKNRDATPPHPTVETLNPSDLESAVRERERDAGREPELFPHAHPEPDHGPRARPKRRIPPDWQASPHLTSFAERLGLDPVETFNAFRDHFVGSGAPKADWEATARNWCRRDAREGKRGAGVRPAGRGSESAAIARAGAAVAARKRGRE